MPTTLNGSCVRIEDDQTLVPAKKTDGEAVEEIRIRDAIERMRAETESGMRPKNIVVDPDGNARIV